MKTHYNPLNPYTAWPAPRQVVAGAFVALFLTVIALSLPAQTVTMRAYPLRITVPLGVSSTSTSTVTVVTGTLGGNAVNFAVTGVPAGASATLSTNSITTDGTSTPILTVTTTAGLAQGTYDLAIEATGAASYRLPVPLICSYYWSGATYTNGGSAGITFAGNWFGGVVPGATDAAVFGNSGATTNTTDSPTNLLISGNVTLGSLRFAQEVSTTNKAYNVEFQPGASLSVVGPGGFSMLRDKKFNNADNGTMDLKFVGNGRFIVSNTVANFASLVDGQMNANLDMRGLDSFYAEVNRLPLGDYRAYPNFFTNGYVGRGTAVQNEVSRFTPQIYLAKTNVIKAVFVDPNNYNDVSTRDYALTLGNYSQQGTTVNLRFSLGQSNAFFLDSICFAQALQGGSGHNFNFQTTNSFALFRGIGGVGSRVSVFAIGDSASPAPPGNANTRGQVNFANQADCKVDALVDRLWLSLDRTNNNTLMTLQASLTYGDGTFDVNTAVLGFQRGGDNLGDAASTGFAGPQGTINVNSNANSAGAVLRVNRDLHLGYTTATATGGTTTPENCWGRVVINGGTVMASNIVCGGVTKFSTNNQIWVGNGKLVVTNAIGAADGRVAVLLLSNACDVTLLGVEAGKTNIFVNVFSAVSSGGLKRVNIPSIAGVTAFPVKVPLISYTSDSSPVFNGMYIVPPAGLYVKSIVDNATDKNIEVTFSDEPPIVVVWRGTINNVWDLTTKNWVTQVGGLQTNFSDGYSVVFDNTVGAGPTTINIPAAVVPGQVAATYGVLVNNQSYSFTNGTMLGGATVYKTGTGNLTISNATLTTSVTINSGALVGNATVGPTLLQAGSTMTNFTGTINGGLAASNAAVTVKGTVNGGLNLQAGSLINLSTINGNVTIATNTTLYNWYGATMNVTLPWTVSTNALLVNNGDIYQFGTGGQNYGLTVKGALQGVGRILQNGSQSPADVRVTIDAGGSLMIGNTPNEIANTTIGVRLDFNNGSTTTFDVDNSGANPVNDKIILDATPSYGKVNFGVGNNLGGTLVINKIAGPAFGQTTTIYPFDLTSNVPDNSQPAIPQITPPPAPGLCWDTFQVITNLTLVTTIPMVYTNSLETTTNGTLNYVFDWPASYRGWRLERQTNSVSVGLESPSTNWVTVFTAYGGTNILYYPDTNDLSTFWIRTTQRLSTTNDGPVADAIFFRALYP
jgi:hypothetical protein